MKGEGQNVEEKTETKNEVVVFKVLVHCEGCAKKVSRCLSGFQGVEDVEIDIANQKVIVRGRNVDSLKVLCRLRKKFSNNTELVSPVPTYNDQKQIQEQIKEPKLKTMVLKMFIHCVGCAHDITRNIERMKGIDSAEADIMKSLVVIRGVFDPPTLVDDITKRLGKHVEIVKLESEGDKAITGCDQFSLPFHPSLVF